MIYIIHNVRDICIAIIIRITKYLIHNYSIVY